MSIVTERDTADLEQAASLLADGRALRNRVLNRIRQRRWKLAQKEKQL